MFRVWLLIHRNDCDLQQVIITVDIARLRSGQGTVLGSLAGGIHRLLAR